MGLNLLLFILQAATSIAAFTLNSCGMGDNGYESKVRHALSTFHINLSHGKYAANRPFVSFDNEWNRNGVLQLGGDNFVTTLATFNDSFRGLQVPDRYHLVDGNVGAVLYYLQGPQTGPFAGIPKSGRLINIIGGELMQFNIEAKVSYLISIEELGIAVEQLSGGQEATPTAVSLFKNPQTIPEFRQQLRDNMASLYRNFNTGSYSLITDLATPDVVVQADQDKGQGLDAFMAIFSADLKSFPDKIFHTDFILADGHLGATESVWEGTQTETYTTTNGSILEPTNQAVRVRCMLFLEFNDQALITSATVVHDEAVVERQLLEKQNEVAYPLYP
jgi:predicted ester cyclase